MVLNMNCSLGALFKYIFHLSEPTKYVVEFGKKLSNSDCIKVAVGGLSFFPLFFNTSNKSYLRVAMQKFKFSWHFPPFDDNIQY